MNFDELIALLRVLNESPSLTPLHDEVTKLVLEELKKWIGKS